MKSGLLAYSVVLLLASVRTLSAQGPSIEYAVSAKNPISHLYNVEMQISGIRTTAVDVAMPAWSPGAYVIRDFAANVQELSAASRQNQPLQIRQLDKQSWRISKASGDDIRLRYRVYSSGLNDEMGDITPAALFMFVAGQTAIPVGVRYETENDWKVYTALEKRGDRYVAGDYQTLVTSPTFLGEFKVLEFKDGAVPFRVVFSNRRVQLTELQVEADLTDILEAAAATLGSLPFKAYTFLVRVQSASGSTSVGYPDSARISVGENDFVSENTYNAFLVSATQALVKSWYGKAARPASMQPFDYSREAYSRILWFTEGAAAYTADMLMVRSGIYSPAEFLLRVSSEIDALQRQPGRLLSSLEDASWNAWSRGENSANAMVSYALKGKIAALLLDAEIRTRTRGEKSLEDVLKRLAETSSKREGLTESALEGEIQSATGVSVAEFFAAVTRSRNELEYKRYLEPLGIAVNTRKTPATIYVGIEFERTDANQARVRRVIPSSPSEAAKLDAGDVIVAMDSDRVTFDNLGGRIRSKPLGKAVALTVLRGDRLLSLSITPGLMETETWSVEESLTATPEQVRLRTAWLAARVGSKAGK
jgi:predicted metalloprotease with PDZ domain